MLTSIEQLHQRGSERHRHLLRSAERRRWCRASQHDVAPGRFRQHPDPERLGRDGHAIAAGGALPAALQRLLFGATAGPRC